MDASPEYESRLGNTTVRMNGRMVGVAAGRCLERGMLVTRDGPAEPADPGAVGGSAGVLENDSDSSGAGDREVEVLGSGTVICVRAGADIRADQTRLKAWKWPLRRTRVRILASLV